MSLLKSDLIAINPSYWWRCDEPFGAASLANSGSQSPNGAAVKGGVPASGSPSLLDVPTETSVFEATAGGADYYQTASTPGMAIGASQGFSLFGLFQVAAPPAVTAVIMALSRTTAWGGFYVAVVPGGYFHWNASSTDTTNMDVTLPPYVSDGVPHSFGFVRAAVGNTMSFYMDGQLIQQRPDPLHGRVIDDTTAFAILGNNGAHNIGFSGFFQHIVMDMAEWDAATYANLHLAAWNDNPPLPASSYQSAMLKSQAAAAADLKAILDAVTIRAY